MCGGGGGCGGTISAEGGQYPLADYVRGGQNPLADNVRGDKICGGTTSAPTPVRLAVNVTGSIIADRGITAGAIMADPAHHWSSVGVYD